MREADVAIRMKEPSQADLIRKRLMSVRMRLYATPSYLEERGVLADVDEIARHRLICQSPSSAQVAAGATLVQHLLSYDVPSMFTVNNYFGVLQGVLNNLGIGVLPDYVTQDFPDLVRVLPDLESGEVPVFLAYPEEPSATLCRMKSSRTGAKYGPPTPANHFILHSYAPYAWRSCKIAMCFFLITPHSAHRSNRESGDASRLLLSPPCWTCRASRPAFFLG